MEFQRIQVRRKTGLVLFNGREYPLGAQIYPITKRVDYDPNCHHKYTFRVMHVIMLDHQCLRFLGTEYICKINDKIRVVVSLFMREIFCFRTYLAFLIHRKSKTLCDGMP